MPAGSSSKRERQYEHIKESYEKRGQKGRAEEIAARTVNKDRAEAGETKKSKPRASASGSKSGSSKKSSSDKPSASSGRSSSSRSSSSRSSSGRSSTSSASSRSAKPQARGEGRSRAELYREAQRKGVEGRSKMNKSQLERAVAK